MTQMFDLAPISISAVKISSVSTESKLIRNRMKKFQCGTQAVSYQRKPSEDSSEWVCLNCNNLNYSFRKRCNRCKVQTRELNEVALMTGYHYYGQLYSFGYTAYENNEFVEAAPQARRQETVQSPKKQPQEEVDIEQKEQLPSVSPLLKRYKASSEKRIREETQNEGNVLCSGSWKSFCAPEPDQDEEYEKESESTLDIEGDAGLLKALSEMII